MPTLRRVRFFRGAFIPETEEGKYHHALFQCSSGGAGGSSHLYKYATSADAVVTGGGGGKQNYKSLELHVPLLPPLIDLGPPADQRQERTKGGAPDDATTKLFLPQPWCPVCLKFGNHACFPRQSSRQDENSGHGHLWDKIDKIIIASFLKPAGRKPDMQQFQNDDFSNRKKRARKGNDPILVQQQLPSKNQPSISPLELQNNPLAGQRHHGDLNLNSSPCPGGELLKSHQLLVNNTRTARTQSSHKRSRIDDYHNHHSYHDKPPSQIPIVKEQQELSDVKPRTPTHDDLLTLQQNPSSARGRLVFIPCFIPTSGPLEFLAN